MSARAEAAAATGERLLAAAWKHFGTQPYEEVRLREISADAGVTEQTLLARFHSKDELLAAAYRWWGASEMERRDAASVDDVPDAVANVFDHYEAHGAAILRMLSQEDRIPAIHDLMERGRAYHRNWAEQSLRAASCGPDRRAQRAPADGARGRDGRAGVEATATGHATHPPPGGKDRPGDDRVLLAAGVNREPELPQHLHGSALAALEVSGDERCPVANS